jgi:predicted methyltransferase
MFSRALAVLLIAAAPALVRGQSSVAIPPHIRSALGDPRRPADQVMRDALRKPGQLMAFAGIVRGARIAELMPGGGYFTRLLSAAVGEKGRVYAYVPSEEIKNCAPSETAPGLALARDRAYSNIVVVVGPIDDFHAPESLDLVWTAQNYHDLYDPFMGPADLSRVDKAIFRSLRHGGVFLVIDHAAAPRSGVRDTNTLHRIDPAVIKRDLAAAGFRLEAESAVLRNPADAHTLRVFDPAIRGRTDQVVLKFVKP